MEHLLNKSELIQYNSNIDNLLKIDFNNTELNDSKLLIINLFNKVAKEIKEKEELNKNILLETYTNPYNNLKELNEELYKLDEKIRELEFIIRDFNLIKPKITIFNKDKIKKEQDVKKQEIINKINSVEDELKNINIDISSNNFKKIYNQWGSSIKSKMSTFKYSLYDTEFNNNLLNLKNIIYKLTPLLPDYLKNTLTKKYDLLVSKISNTQNFYNTENIMTLTVNNKNFMDIYNSAENNKYYNEIYKKLNELKLSINLSKQGKGNVEMNIFFIIITGLLLIVIFILEKFDINIPEWIGSIIGFIGLSILGFGLYKVYKLKII
jgi:hypothetical protein